MHRRHLLVLDAAVPALVGAVIVVGERLHGGASTQPAAIVLGLAAAACLWARRRAPVLTLVASGALVAVLLHIDPSAAAVGVLAPAVALYSLALQRGRIVELVAGLAAVGAVIAADAVHGGAPTLLQTAGHALLVAIPLLAAEQVRTHRAYLSLAEAQLEAAEQSREQEAQRRAEQERMRIARELHDVVAHTLTEINVQAGATAERLEPGETRAAVEKIEETSRAAVGELRAILGVLRDPESGVSPRAPAPQIDDIPELVERAREGGVEVRLEVSGDRPPRISDTVSLAAYRIVQESLTNARRHATGAPVRVRLRYDPAQLSVAIENPDGLERRNGSAPGIGIEGMVERAAAVGGTLRAAPTSGGFAVRAVLPYQPAR